MSALYMIKKEKSSGSFKKIKILTFNALKYLFVCFYSFFMIECIIVKIYLFSEEFMQIALLTTPYLESFYRNALSQIKLDTVVTVYAYYAYPHVVALYQQIEEQYDGFLVGGTAPMRIIEGSYPEHKPIRNIECGISNFYREINRVIFEYQDFDLKYAYFDFCDYVCPRNERSLIDLMKEGRFEEWFEDNQKYMDQMSPEEMWRTLDEIRNRHIQLWQSGQIKYSLSRRSLILPDIMEAGVNCRFINCSNDDILRTYQLLVNDITIQKLEKNRPAVISVTTEDYTPENVLILTRALHNFSRKNFLDFLIEKHENHLKIFSNYHAAERITQNFSSCTLKPFLEHRCKFPVYLGYGVGETLQNALSNSSSALKAAQNSADHTSYLINETKETIALCGSGNLITLPRNVSPQVLDLADKTGFSTLTIQKVLKAHELLGDVEFTSKDLAETLHITLRSANRILDTLVRYNLAVVLYNRQDGSKGRPQKVYQMMLNLPS